MTIANRQFKTERRWLCLGDRATAKDAIKGVIVNDGKTTEDKSIAVTFMGVNGVLFHWDFDTADRLNGVLDELGLEYHPNKTDARF